MKNKKNYIFILLFTTLNLFPDEIEISLPTKNQIPKIYIGSCNSTEYKLCKIINYILKEDFTLDGRCTIHSPNEELLTLEKKKGNDLYQNPIWKKKQINYVIIPSLSKNILTCNLFMVRNGIIKTLKEIKLLDTKADNISILHKISDFLMKEIYGTPGIASKKILYSFRPNQQVDDNNYNKNNWKAEIHEIDSLGMATKRITFDNSYSITPYFIASANKEDKYRFVYVTYKIGQPQIYLGKEEGTEGIPFINLRGNQLLPAISFDGKYITFISDASGKSDVFIQELNRQNHPSGKPIQIYSGIDQTCSSPSLSPDNKHLAFVNDKTGIAKIYLANIENTLFSRTPPHLIEIRCECSECTSPSFSPNGEKITFSGKINGRRQIWVYDIEKKNAYQITSGPEDRENPCFGASNKHIVYNTTYPSTDIYILSLDKNIIRKLTKGIGDKHYPNFEQ